MYIYTVYICARVCPVIICDGLGFAWVRFFVYYVCCSQLFLVKKLNTQENFEFVSSRM